MGKFKRIPVKDINAMRKILDDLPDRNLGKTREEAAKLLNAVAVSPEEVELTRATEIRLNNEYYTLQKDGDKISYALKEA